jgi:hypothetical protein
MSSLVWWTPERLAWLAARAAEGWTAAAIAAAAARRWRRTPRLSAEGVRDAARRAGIKLLARGGRPFSIRNPKSAIRNRLP